MSKLIDLTEKKFNRLTVIKRAENTKNGAARWLCKCDCGNTNHIIVTSRNLISGHTKSCGCLQDISRIKSHKKYNTYDLSGEYGIGYTSKGESFYFDLEDYNKIKDYCWRINKDNYVVTKNGTMFHRIVTECPLNYLVDHKHGERTRNDNRKYNLRICTNLENNKNQKIKLTNTSGTTGVVWNKKNNKWIAQITVNYKNIYLGSFINFEDAVKARKEAEEKYFGEWSYDNSVRETNGK